MLVGRGLMTGYQLERLLRGDRDGYFFGDYKILALAGQGTFARVYRAVNVETNEVVAIKSLRARFCELPAQFGLFIREGELGISLRHPNIVKTFAVHSVARTHFLVMEFVEGRSLREYIHIKGALKPSEATYLAMGICRGLDYAFQRAITHRDLRTANVLVSSQGEAKLVDFGLATADEALSENIDFEAPSTRTIDYAALERATGVRKDDPRSDVYFAGCIYYNMLTGMPPLVETRNRSQRLITSRFSDIPPIQDLHPDLPLYVVKALNKAMALDPNSRYQSPGDLAAELESSVARLGQEFKDRPEPMPTGKKQDGRALPAQGPQQKDQYSVMVVESNVRMQDVFREGLKKAGYRVLVTNNPDRALDRLVQDIGVVDCLVLNAQEIGESAVQVFNRLPEDSATQGLPALLLLEQNQAAWRKDAQVADHRVILTMPITMKQLRETIGRIIPLCQGFAASA
jgi:serine/threonine-protein kinase